MSMDINATLEERSKTHGNFKKNAELSQDLKESMRCGHKWHVLALSQREALDMISSKIARILTGNANEPDHWRDIAGYATLIANDLMP